MTLKGLTRGAQAGHKLTRDTISHPMGGGHHEMGGGHHFVGGKPFCGRDTN